jgi:cytochrome b6-f complex iron-sulfur subunit
MSQHGPDWILEGAQGSKPPASSSLPAAAEAEPISRRAVAHWALILVPLAYALAAVAAAVKYLSPRETARRKSRLEVGDASRFESGAVERVELSGESVFILRDSTGSLAALSASCTHTGCNVNWSVREGCFVCPCHAGRFDRDGKVIQRPPVEPLRRRKIIVDGGKVVLLDEPQTPAKG